MLIVLVILIAIFLFTKYNNNTEKEIKFFGVDSIDIVKIELTKGGEITILAKDGDTWKMIQPVESKLDEKNLNSLFERGLTVVTSKIPVSENESALEIYNLTDSLGTKVKLMGNKDNILADVVLGSSSQWNNTPARKVGENKIYRLSSSINLVFGPNTDYWRNKELLYIFADNIQEMRLLADNLDYSVTATDSLWKVEYLSETTYVGDDNEFLSAIFENLKMVKAAMFYNEDYSKIADRFNDPQFKIMIKLKSGEDIELVFADSDQSGYRFMKVNGKEDELYYVSNWWSDKFIQRAKLL